VELDPEDGRLVVEVVDAFGAERFAVVFFAPDAVAFGFAVDAFLAVDVLALDVFCDPVFDEPRRPTVATLLASFGALSAIARPICGARFAT
jgi:hypothetical protein